MSSWNRSSWTSGLVLVEAIVAIVAGGVLAIDRIGVRAPRRPAVHQVSGKLFVNGLPAANASIALHPIGQHLGNIYRPVGSTRKDGSFSLMTFSVDDGAPEGEYAVTILWTDPTQPYDECGDLTIHDMLKGRYLDAARTSLRVRVVSDQNEIRLMADNPGSWTVARRRDMEPLDR